MFREFFKYNFRTAEFTRLRHKIALVTTAILLSATVAVNGRDGSKDWIVLEDCHLIVNPANDGASFHVRVTEKEYIFRLYLVDAPETDAADPARLIEQAKHFGISVPQAIELGERAKSFVQETLAKPFTVHTRMANAMGRSNSERFYAFVQTNEGDLGEQLIANGLARIYGRRAPPPNGKNLKNWRTKQSNRNWEAGPRISNVRTLQPNLRRRLAAFLWASRIKRHQQPHLRPRGRTRDCSLPSSTSTPRRKKS
jgi:endonuclease YncB( thermonuclease family)